MMEVKKCPYCHKCWISVSEDQKCPHCGKQNDDSDNDVKDMLRNLFGMEG